MIGVRRVVWLFSDPATVFAVAAGLACGGIGATYPTAFLGEGHAPGAGAGLLLGLVAALGASPLWAFGLAVAASAGPTARALRLVLHAHGRGQLAVRRTELGAVASRVVVGAVAGAAGGLVSVLLQPLTSDAPTGLFSLAPSAVSYVLAVGVAVLAVAVGYAVGAATADVSGSLILVSAVMTISAVLVGAAYFSPNVGFMASMTPLGGLLVAAKDQLLAPQFTDELSTLPALIGALLWTVLLLLAAARRTRRQVG